MNLTEEASENFLLTIGIPTFNREHSLSRTLEDLIKQVRSSKNQSNLEILVSDNCSTDNTRSIVKNYMGVNEDISLSYFKNQSNLGYDGNCNQVFKYAQGCFVWLMSDDDAIDNFAVKKIYNICKKYSNVDVIFVNYRLYDSTFTDVISDSDCNLEGENIELTNANSFYDITNFSNSSGELKPSTLTSDERYIKSFTVRPGHHKSFFSTSLKMDVPGRGLRMAKEKLSAPEFIAKSTVCCISS